VIGRAVLAAAVLALAGPAFVVPALADDTCHLYRASEMEMSFGDDGVSVPMTVAGRRVNLLIDTGAIYSMLTEDVVSALKLRKRRIFSADMTMWGGVRVDHYVTANDIDLGGLKATEMNFLVMPNGRTAPDIGGLLAPEVLSAYDDDFDFANGRFSLFQPDNCGGKEVYWARHWSQIGFDIDDSGHARLPVSLDGKGLTVTLDTGANRSVMSLELAESLFGFDARSPLLQRVETEDGSAAYRYPFAALSFGGVRISRPDILLIPDSVSQVYGPGRALLGIGVLQRLHLYLSYREKTLFVTAADAHL
jgi:predicted aspartyl protease